MAIRRKRIESLSEEILREANVLEPPVPIEAIAKSRGIQVRFQKLESDLSGFLYAQGPVSVIGVNTHHSKVRQRFTIAHELGHFLLHRPSDLHVDRSFQMKRSNISSQGTDENEIEANLFAAELLMPRSMLAQDLETIDELDVNDEEAIHELAGRYKVSTQALLLRLMRLGYIDQ